MHKTTIYLSEETEKRMRQAAKRLGRSRADLTRTALEEFLDRSERERGLPPSVGMGADMEIRAADDERWLKENWRPR